MPIHAAAFSGAKTCLEILLKKGKYNVPKKGVAICCFSSQITVKTSNYNCALNLQDVIAVTPMDGFL